MADTREKLIKAIEVLADKITKDIKADDALKFTQAAQNAANAIRTLPIKENDLPEVHNGMTFTEPIKVIATREELEDFSIKMR